jgi:nucleoid-associated protein YgaU
MNQRPGGSSGNGAMVLPPLGASNPDSNPEPSKDSGVRLGKPATIPTDSSQFARAPVVTPPAANQPAPAPARMDPPPDAVQRSAPTPVIVPAVSPTIGQDAITQVGNVDSYDEETYICRANDNFRSISQAYFRTDKYERALILFNRAHPLATAAVAQNPPALREGLPVFIPPARILEKYYCSVIGDAPLPPLNAGSSSEKMYRVKGNGEMFYDIARRTLGRGERWQEIYRLNPSFDPKDPVPAGTDLRLPADARIE